MAQWWRRDPTARGEPQPWHFSNNLLSAQDSDSDEDSDDNMDGSGKQHSCLINNDQGRQHKFWLGMQILFNHGKDSLFTVAAGTACDFDGGRKSSNIQCFENQTGIICFFPHFTNICLGAPSFPSVVLTTFIATQADQLPDIHKQVLSLELVQIVECWGVWS